MSKIDKHLEGATFSMVATGSVAAATMEIPHCGQRWRDNVSALPCPAGPVEHAEIVFGQLLEPAGNLPLRLFEVA
ncbi:hypothetical protein T03_7890 [Trichinella britovi]|uniref:Uncharacterized protein n=2 Tax=Trichinella TaxID=6333 RepID=A0A0V0TDK3_9BILA|nr:hypothetical protein T05_11779 [Trichinella murrelli]KRX37041.1 hypothetical protein T05_13094 [Trichinella murrelli]KRX39368.1 hypothetical protein T05_616 [Trichinella murrelli]KRY56568.1 hypothetical protein T03_7890 [Trichinella britovi]